ncbi:hypothetical protein [Mesorhizobium sp. LSJC269B00]|uniref:DUF6932 family protein n=1 Tax=Mesorhizobium sp. LSJC269B00 TaxID=1287326 RepID=UPI00067E9212|nr:hypothetical protein [Mesorhizobium sp. LSJC269B00]
MPIRLLKRDMGRNHRATWELVIVQKDEFPPLLPAGLHRMTEDELKVLVVDAFPLSTKRPLLWQRFLNLMDEARQLKLEFEVWIDGSFLTQKIEPSDVDFVLDFDVDAINNPAPSQVPFLRELANQAFKPQKLHSFIMFHAPTAHGQHAEGERLHDQWVKDFGFSYVAREPKGIAVLEVIP